MQCYICNTQMEYKEIMYDNPKWGCPGVTVPEKAKAWVCSKCGEIIFDSSEVILLQELSQGYE